MVLLFEVSLAVLKRNARLRFKLAIASVCQAPRIKGLVSMCLLCAARLNTVGTAKFDKGK
jgi:hypothetical protein